MKTEILHNKLERYIAGKSHASGNDANSNLVILHSQQIQN